MSQQKYNKTVQVTIIPRQPGKELSVTVSPPPLGFSDVPTSLNKQDTALSVRVCHTGLGLVTLDPNKGVVEGGDQAEGTHGGHIREVRKGVLGIAYKQLWSCKSILISDIKLFGSV